MPIPKILNAGDLDACYRALDGILGDADLSNFTNINIFANRDTGGVNAGISVTDPEGNSANVGIRVVGARVSVLPAAVTLGPSQTQQFTATVTLPDGTVDPAPVLTWTVGGSLAGTIDQTGLYTAPATVTPGAVDIIECRTADGSKSTVSVTLTETVS